MQFDIVANDKATGTMRAAEGAMDKFTSRLTNNFSKIAMKAAAAYAIISKMGAVFKEGAGIADEAKRLNVSIENLQRYKAAGDIFGISPQELVKGFKDLNKLMDEAATKGKGDQFEALKALGFGDQEIINREVKRAEVLERLSEAIKSVTDEEQKFAIASRIFGDKSAMSLQPILQDPKGFAEAFANAKVLSDKQVMDLDAADDKLTSVVQKATTLVQQGIASAVGVFTGDDTAGTNAEKPITDEARARAKALLGVGATVEKGNTDGGGGLAVTSLQEIGGGLGKGINITELYAERTAQATETIAAVVTGAPAPAPSATDITKGSAAPSTEGGGSSMAITIINKNNSLMSRHRSF
jgi:hypothetical protein